MKHSFTTRKGLSFLLFLGLFTTTFSTANCQDSMIETDGMPFDCNSNLCLYTECATPPRFEIEATLLYLKPSIDDSHFVLSSFDNTFGGSLFPNGRRHGVSVPYTPGFRVEGLYNICPASSAFDIRFTYLEAHGSKSVTGDFLYDTNGFPGFGAQDSPVYAGTASDKNTYHVYTGDTTYNWSYGCFAPNDLTFIVGLHYAYIKFHEKGENTGVFIGTTRPISNLLHRKSQFFGAGPEFGINYEYLLPNFSCLGGTLTLNANARGALLYGSTKSDMTFVTLRTGPVGVAFRNTPAWRITPMASAELSLSYHVNCGCVPTVFELGYEFMWYSKAVNKITGTDVAFSGDTIDVFNSLSLQGPYLSINASF